MFCMSLHGFALTFVELTHTYALYGLNDTRFHLLFTTLVLHFVLPAEHGAFAMALLLHGFLRVAAFLDVCEALGVLLGDFAALLFRLVVFFNQLFFFRLRRFGASAASGSSVELFAAPPFL